MKKTTVVSSGLTLALCVLITGCGLADVGAAAATQGASAAEQAKEAKKLEDKVQKQIEEAQRVEKQQRDAALQASEGN